jgi:hypothetical protein
VKSISWANGDVDTILAVNSENQLPYLNEKYKDSFYFANGDTMDVSEFKSLLVKHDLNGIWEQYNLGHNQLTAGMVFVFFGTIADIGGIIVKQKSVAANAPIIAGTLFVVGGIAEIAGIICIIVGGSKMATAINSYQDLSRKRPSYSYNTTLKIGATSNGIGFTLNF